MTAKKSTRFPYFSDLMHGLAEECGHGKAGGFGSPLEKCGT